MIKAVLALAAKDLRLLLRDRGALFFTLAWPVITAVLFGLVFSGGGGSAKPRIVASDLDRTEASQRFVAQLDAMQELDVDVQDEAAARELVRTGKRTAAVIVPRGFGAAAERVFYGAPPKLELVIDPSRKAEQAMVQGMLQKLAGQRMAALMSGGADGRAMIDRARGDIATLGESERAPYVALFDALDGVLGTQAAAAAQPSGTASAWEPLAVEVSSVQAKRRGPANAFGVTFPQGMLWAIVGCVMSFATSLVLERTQGTLVRLRASPLSAAQIMFGKTLACFVAILVLLALLVAMAVLGFGVRPSSFALLALAALVAAFAFSGMMMLFASLGRTVQAVSGIGWALMMPLMLLGGGMVPLFAMPTWMAEIGSASPVKWTVLAFEGAIWREFSLAEMALPLGILLAVGVATLAFGSLRFASRAPA